MFTFFVISRLLGWAVAAFLAGYANTRAAQSPAWPRYTLKAEQAVQLNLPNQEQFDASGLLLLPSGELLTLNDRDIALYRVQFLSQTNAADLHLLPDCFTPDQLVPFEKSKFGRYDCEGIARDDQGRLYLCEEADRWILRWDPKTKHVERLDIDWSPVKRYFASDRNASFEGIAIGQGKLYVANERDVGRIMVVDLATLKVSDHFSVRPRGSLARDVHYTDLCWFDGALFVLLRESSLVLQVDPVSHKVRAEYSFRELENQPEVVYYTRLPTSTMEGLAVDQDTLWLLTDNNGLGRVRYPNDMRPTLFKCPRPDRRQ